MDNLSVMKTKIRFSQQYGRLLCFKYFVIFDAFEFPLFLYFYQDNILIFLVQLKKP